MVTPSASKRISVDICLNIPQRLMVAGGRWRAWSVAAQARHRRALRAATAIPGHHFEHMSAQKFPTIRADESICTSACLLDAARLVPPMPSFWKKGRTARPQSFEQTETFVRTLRRAGRLPSLHSERMSAPLRQQPMAMVVRGMVASNARGARFEAASARPEPNRARVFLDARSRGNFLTLSCFCGDSLAHYASSTRVGASI